MRPPPPRRLPHRTPFSGSTAAPSVSSAQPAPSACAPSVDSNCRSKMYTGGGGDGGTSEWDDAVVLMGEPRIGGVPRPYFNHDGFHLMLLGYLDAVPWSHILLSPNSHSLVPTIKSPNFLSLPLTSILNIARDADARFSLPQGCAVVALQGRTGRTHWLWLLPSVATTYAAMGNALAKTRAILSCMHPRWCRDPGIYFPCAQRCHPGTKDLDFLFCCAANLLQFLPRSTDPPSSRHR